MIVEQLAPLRRLWAAQGLAIEELARSLERASADHRELLMAARKERDRLCGWLVLIEGSQCDAERLRQAAYDAITLLHEPPEAL